MKLVILGGGFGGLRLARKLSNKKGIDILVIDKYNYHQFQPLFYQVATSGLDASNISFPFRKAFQGDKNIRYRMAEIKSIDSVAKLVKTDEENFEYDNLVIATGADTNFFNNAQMETYAFPMKSTVEALQIRHRLLHNFEDILYAETEAEKQRLLNIVVVGGGPTGVEMSGAIADLRNDVLPKDYPEIDFSKMNIYLMEGGEQTLNTMSDKSSADSLRYLKEMGVKVELKTLLSDYDGKTASTKDGQKIETAMVIWAAGIKGNVPEGINPDLVVKGNRIKVNRFCEVEGMDHIYALGDVSYMEEPAWPKGHPQVAPVAIQMGDLIAHNMQILVHKNGKERKEFEYNDKGSMATVGRNLAVVDVPKPKLHFKGFFAWMIWMTLHLMLILGVKNKFAVFSNWLYNYFTRDQNLRLIFKAFYREKKKEGPKVLS